MVGYWSNALGFVKLNEGHFLISIGVILVPVQVNRKE
jgi:hypothetical protein